MSAAPPSTSPSPRRRRRRWSPGVIVLLVALGLFTAGVVHLFDLRFSTGEIYPVYSGFRSDPLGTKALFYSLQALPGLRVERNVRPLRYLGEEPSAVLKHRDDDPNPMGDSGAAAVFYLGAEPYEWPFLVRDAEATRLEKIMERGGRVIMAFMPTTIEMTAKRLENNRREQRRELDGKDDAKKTKNGGKDQDPNHKGKDKDKKDGKPPAVTPPPATPAPPLTPAQKLVVKDDLAERWHVDFLRTDDRKDAGKPGTKPPAEPLDETAVPVPGMAAGLQPVTWHSVVSFDLDAPATKKAGWRALYTRSKHPVIVARPFGSAGGELVLVGDPYFFSNEALRKEPRPGLIAALVGRCRRVIFDETHLGVAEKPGLMTLARRYHLQGALAALAVLAVLFLWKNMVSLVPPPAAESAGASPEGNFVTGRDSAEGFVNLLRRGVPARDLLKTCLAQWRAANALPGSRSPGAEVESRLNAIAAEEAARPVHRRSAVTAYRAMCAVLKRRGVAPGP